MISKYQYTREQLEEVITIFYPNWRLSAIYLPEALAGAIINHWLEGDQDLDYSRAVLESAWRDLRVLHGYFIFKEQ